MKSNSLSFDALVVGRDGAPLTQPVTRVVDAGRLLAVRGDNGSGKSTLLKTVAGLVRPLSGAATFRREGAVVTDGVLYIGHQLGLAPGMSVYDNVALWARLSGAPELTAAAMHYFDLGDIADVPLRQLSAGWQQRVALTRLITVPALFWLLDEPTSHLDAGGIALLQSLLHSRLEQGGIAVVATHGELQGEFVDYFYISMLN